ncbi:putative copper-transporting ATPase [Venturia inaequalis]|nr:putative copper-transporting ATPase [Venturia inaequalis]
MTQKPPPEQGYPRLASRMGLFPETAIFTRFSDLTARNLLYLQAELLHLRNYLEDMEMRARSEDKEKAKKMARSWWDLCNEAQEEGIENGQWNLILSIREKLKEYEKALIRAKTIAHFHKPFNSDLHDLQAYIDSPHMDTRPFRAVESSVWGNLNHPKDCARDLAALRIRQVDDPFTEMVMTRLVRPFFRIIGHRFMKKDPALEVYADGECKDDTAREFARAITTFLACIILVGSINVLYFIPKSSMVSRIGAIWAFSVVFALCLLVFAKGKPIEVFSATAAFTAVQVVFISGNS